MGTQAISRTVFVVIVVVLRVASEPVDGVGDDLITQREADARLERRVSGRVDGHARGGADDDEAAPCVDATPRVVATAALRLDVGQRRRALQLRVELPRGLREW